MRVKTAKETTERYVRGSVEAFLDGQKDLKWISGILLHSGLLKEPTLEIVLSLGSYGDPARAGSLLNWLQTADFVAVRSS